MKYIVEFEGFLLRCGFIFKEIVVLCLETSVKHHYFLKSPRGKYETLSLKERRSIGYCENHLHGIRWKSGRSNYYEVRKSLRELVDSESVVYTKGCEKAQILKNQIGFTCSVRDINNIPGYADTFEDWVITAKRFQEDSSKNVCSLRFHKYNVHCSSIKAIIFQRYLTQHIHHQHRVK